MTTIPPHKKAEHIRNVAVDIILTILTCFLYNVYVQYKQILAVNDMLNQQRYSFGVWLLLTLITCGLYHIYHEYRKSTDISVCLGKDGSVDGLVNVVLTLFGLGVVADAIQQSEINRYYGDASL